MTNRPELKKKEWMLSGKDVMRDLSFVKESQTRLNAFIVQSNAC